MSKLVVSENGSIVNQFFLESEVFTIGRGEDNTLRLEDPMVSREHARISTVMHDQILADLNSANGTIVNGAKIDKHILQHGDVIELGRFRLKYLNPKVVHGAAFDRTMMTPAMQSAAKPEVQVSVPARHTRSHFPLGAIIGKSGKETELNRVLHVVGAAGKQLAAINRRPQGYTVTHVYGRRTPRVNGERIGAGPRLLKANDVIEVGGETLQFLLKT
jgi:pSer/pThr/pTyr-binding forkhead associated (FHA) protein